jgi:quercetin dioxygenase-like cupin family protein
LIGAAIAVAMMAASSLALAKSTPRAVVTAQEDVKWSSAGIPGVSTAAVQGDMAKGPSHFYLKYAKGFVTPPHHHTPDHYVTVVSGTLVLTVNGKDHRLTPGSYFALTGKIMHTARVEGDEDAVMFVDARGPWDVVLEEGAAAKQ